MMIVYNYTFNKYIKFYQFIFNASKGMNAAIKHHQLPFGGVILLGQRDTDMKCEIIYDVTRIPPYICPFFFIVINLI